MEETESSPGRPGNHSDAPDVPLDRREAVVRAAIAQAQAQDARDRIWGLYSLTIAIFAFVTLSIFRIDAKHHPLVLLVVAAIALLAYFIEQIWRSLRRVERASRVELAKLEARTEDALREAGTTTDLNALLNVNRALLSQYHGLSTGQARMAFRMAVFVMAAGALVLTGGAALAVSASSTVTGVTVAGLSGLASAIGGYISSTLLRTYQVSVRQAEAYFREPVVASYLLAAERVARTLDGESQQAALGRVVDGFMRAATGAASLQDPAAGEPTATDQGMEGGASGSV
ncbi:hypothetical protein ACFY1B_48835 [Streptomyces mirabilis]|uniref:TRADD-N-associated membrane domain-containing protein n=1 Tax=Streptomyces mirabilis TaxID=68239 RepID=UPI00369C17FE